MADDLKEYDQSQLRAAFVSLFWSIIGYKKRHENFKLKAISDYIGINKSEPSKWFSGARPNWTINTIADIAGALDMDIEIRATDRKTGRHFAPHGVVDPVVTSSGTGQRFPAAEKGIAAKTMASEDARADTREPYIITSAAA